MTTTIHLNTNFDFSGTDSGKMTLPPYVNMIGDLLRHMGNEMDLSFMDADGKEIRRDIEVMINGKDIGFYSTGLKTELNDKDSVIINLVPLGGG